MQITIHAVLALRPSPYVESLRQSGGESAELRLNARTLIVFSDSRSTAEEITSSPGLSVATPQRESPVRSDRDHQPWPD